MQRFDEGKEVFFDTVEFFSSEESFVVREELDCVNLGYDIWLSELKSVKDRRENFLVSMGFKGVSSVNDVAPNEESETMGVDRVGECSGAVSCSSPSSVEENLVCDRRELNGEANCLVEESGEEWSENLSIMTERETTGSPSSPSEVGCSKMQGHVENCEIVDVKKKKTNGWLRSFLCKMKKSRGIDASTAQKFSDEERKLTQVKVQQKNKKCKEFTAVYAEQEIRAHKGLIWTMKFSPDGQYLATGGEDGIVRIWSVSSVEASCTTSTRNLQSNNLKGNSTFKRKQSRIASIVVPEKIFHIDESPLHELHGHTSDILDLAWSTSNHLLSSSKDNTVRLWQVGSNKCHSIFLHNNYVTSIHFNPVDESHFISGSIDGIVRIWGVQEKRVIDWADTRDLVTCVHFQPSGKGFITGFISGACRFYEVSGCELLLRAEMQISGKKKSSGSRITGIQFLDNDSQRVMITSEDSKIRILDGLDIVHKYKGLAKSGGQTSASFTSTGQHIVSVGKDSRIYVWNYDSIMIQLSKAKKSARSCEHFSFEGVSIAIPYSGMGTEKRSAGNDSTSASSQTCSNRSSYSWARDQERFSLASWFSMDVSSKTSATWPEEKLPTWELQYPEQDDQTCNCPDDHLQQLHQHQNNSQSCGNFPASWGLVFVTAGMDGMIRTFHNFGLPMKT